MVSKSLLLPKFIQPIQLNPLYAWLALVVQPSIERTKLSYGRPKYQHKNSACCAFATVSIFVVVKAITTPEKSKQNAQSDCFRLSSGDKKLSRQLPGHTTNDRSNH